MQPPYMKCEWILQWTILSIYFYCSPGLDYTVAFRKVLTMYQTCLAWIDPSRILSYPLSPIPGIVSKGIIFNLHIRVRVFALYLLSHTLLWTSFPHPLESTPPARTCSTFLFSHFVKERKNYFCFIKIATQRVSLWHFVVYMYYNPNWFMSSIFLFLPYSPSYDGFNKFKNSILILV
jgi:hypothetical protein